MKVLSFFLLMAALSMTTESARKWNVGDNGLVRWDLDCKFEGLDEIAQKTIPGDHCGRFCMANDGCTHFTHKGGICHLKKSTIHWQEEGEYLSACGFIPSRSKQKYE